MVLYVGIIGDYLSEEVTSIKLMSGDDLNLYTRVYDVTYPVKYAGYRHNVDGDNYSYYFINSNANTVNFNLIPSLMERRRSRWLFDKAISMYLMTHRDSVLQKLNLGN